MVRRQKTRTTATRRGRKPPIASSPKASAREIIIEPKDKPEGTTLCEGKERCTYRVVHHPAWIEYICFVCPSMGYGLTLPASQAEDIGQGRPEPVSKRFHDRSTLGRLQGKNLNRVAVTVKDELVGILPHKWV